MSISYIKHIFEIEDGKVKFERLGQKQRGRKSGYNHSDETKAKIAERMRNRVKTEEVKQKISNSLKGRPKPDEVKDKISESKTEHSVGRDLLTAYGVKYTGPRPPRDRFCPELTTEEWLARCGHDTEEVREWLLRHYEDFEAIAEDVQTESYLKAVAIKEESLLELEPGNMRDDYH